MVSHAGTQNFRTVAPFLHGLVQGFVDEKLMEWDGWVGCAGYVVWVAQAMWWVAGAKENNAKPGQIWLSLAELGLSLAICIDTCLKVL